MSVIKLVPVDISIASSYDKAGKSGGPRSALTPLAKLGKAGIAHPEMHLRSRHYQTQSQLQVETLESLSATETLQSRKEPARSMTTG